MQELLNINPDGQSKGNTVEEGFANKKQRLLAVSLVGAPNVGKSTLTNAIVGEKITIASPKAHTTDHIVKGVKIIGDTQIVFLDHPGFVKGRWIEQIPDTAQYVCIVLDATHPWQHNIKPYIRFLQKEKQPFTIIVNKGDLVPKSTWIQIIEELKTLDYADVVWFISALYQKGLDKVMEYLQSKATEGEWWYSVGQKHEQTRKEIILECVREKVFHLTHKEVPYGVQLKCRHLKVGRHGWTAHVDLIPERDGQKAIIIGRNGSVIKSIGEAARMELCMRFGPGRLFLECV